MPQTIALNPTVAQFNVPKLMQDAQGRELSLEAARMNNEGRSVDLYEKKQKAGALDSYRKKAKAKDTNAADELAGYPDIQKQVMTMFDGATPEEYHDNMKRVKAFGDAARYVESFEDGTPEKQAAWEEKLDELGSGGFLPPEQIEEFKAAGPNDLMLNNALDVHDWVKEHYKTLHDDRRKEIETYKADLRSKTELGKAKIKGDTDLEKAALKEEGDAAADEVKARDTESKIADRKHRQTMAESRATRDAANVKSQIAARDAKAAKDGGKTDRDDTKTRIDVERLINDHFKGLNLDDPKFKEDYPDDYEEAVKIQDAYSTRMLKEFGFDKGGKRTPAKTASSPAQAKTAGPPPLAERVVGQVYESPNGPVTWTGKGWTPAKAE